MKRTVLIIDDETAVLDTIAAYLEDSGFATLQATDGRSGLELFNKNAPDIVLVDLRMPEIDGLDVLDTICREAPGLPVIVVSGTGVVRDAIEALHLGAWDFITKPIQDMAVLEYAIQRSLERANLLRENKRYREHLEEEIRKRTIELAERTAELEITNQRLQREMAERDLIEREVIKARKLESIGLFAAGIAHDFNNILAGILGNISLAKMYAGGEEKVAKRLTEAENAVQRAKDLTQQLLTFSKGGAPVRRTASIKDLIRDSANFALSGSAVRGVFKISEDLWPGEVDEGQISQVVHNLVLNAKQAMPGGGIVEVAAENFTAQSGMRLPFPAGRYIKVSVKDSGGGIPEQHADKIFDPYFTTKASGTGLGLATSYTIIKRHDGYITFESQPGQTIFIFYLPVAPPTAKKAEPAAVPLTEKGNILVMDDEKIVREISGEILSYLGYRVAFAVDGSGAVEQYEKAKASGAPFDAVIVDLNVPNGMGAKETVRRLLELDPGARIIASSGFIGDPLISDFAHFGIKGILAKPYKIEELDEVLQRVLKR